MSPHQALQMFRQELTLYSADQAHRIGHMMNVELDSHGKQNIIQDTEGTVTHK